MAAIFRNAKIVRRLFWSAFAATFAIAFLWYFGSNYEWVEQKFRTGMTGEARRNPLHAAELLFQRLDIPTKKIEHLSELFDLPPRTTVILWTAQAFDQSQIERLAQWVERGGRIIVDADSGRLNKRLGLRTVGRYTPKRKEETVTALAIDGRVLDVELRGAWLLDAERPLRRSVVATGGKVFWFRPAPGDCANDDTDECDDDEPSETPPRSLSPQARTAQVLVHFALGRGYVTAVGNFAMFDNAKIGYHDHAEYLARIALLAGDPGTIYLAPDPHYPSLVAWLAQHAWPALIAASILLGAWLWRAMPRFGPRETPPPPGRPGLLEHLRAVAEFHLKRRDFAALLAPLQEDCLRALQMHATREGAPREPAALAERLTGLAAADIGRALRDVPMQRAEFLHHASVLSRIRDALQPPHSHFKTR